LTYEIVPLNARFLESQVFFDEKEGSILEEKENNSGEEAPLYYDIDAAKNKAVYLLKIPVGNAFKISFPNIIIKLYIKDI